MLDRDAAKKRMLSSLNNRRNLEAALRTVAAGLPVFPVKAEHRGDGQYALIPVFQSGPRTASKNPERVRSWWHEIPRAIPAIPCSDIVVIQTRCCSGAGRGC